MLKVRERERERERQTARPVSTFVPAKTKSFSFVRSFTSHENVTTYPHSFNTRLTSCLQLADIAADMEIRQAFKGGHCCQISPRTGRVASPAVRLVFYPDRRHGRGRGHVGGSVTAVRLFRPGTILRRRGGRPVHEWQAAVRLDALLFVQGTQHRARHTRRRHDRK